MSRLDIVVFGATGFTGKKAVEELVRVAKKYPGLTWGVAGRSQSKLETLMADIGKLTGENLSSIRIIVADVSDEESIKHMCEQAQVIANCCGPYKLYGEPVVKAAVATKTHVVDVSGEPFNHNEMLQLFFQQQETNSRSLITISSFEDVMSRTEILIRHLPPIFDKWGHTHTILFEATLLEEWDFLTQFIESMQLKYDEAAREAGVYIVSACGFDSIPNDMGLVYMQQNFDGTLNSVESYLRTEVAPEYNSEAAKNGVIHYGTWESLVNGICSRSKLPALRKQLYPDRLPSFKPKLHPRGIVHKHDGQYCLPFPGSDASIVYRTQRHAYEVDHKRPVQFKPYVKLPSLFATLLTSLVATILLVMANFSLTRMLLLKYPRLFSAGMVSHEGPTDNVMNNTSFMFELYGEGWEKGADVDGTKPTKKAVVRVKGVNPGYGATVTALIYSAITCLKEHDKMPGNGGVLTTGIAFAKTDLIKNLNENNLTFEYVQN